MKKKRIVSFLLVGVLIAALFIPQVNAFAMDVLSNFRVGQTKTINITLDDVAQMSATMQTYAEAAENGDLDDALSEQYETVAPAYDHETPDTAAEGTELEDIDGFTAFPVNLPRSLEGEPVSLYATAVQEKTFVTEDGTEVRVALSPSLLAKYDNVLFAATQGISDTLSSEQRAQLHQQLVDLPIWTENIRTQLSAIDPDTKDIYLPVLTGISREASIGSTTGYFYGMTELQGLAGALPEAFDALDDADAQASENLNVLVWTKDGVLYMLAGNLPEAELIEAARSV